MAIQIYNRRTAQLETEIVFQRWFMNMAYGTSLGRASATLLWSRKWFSRLYGALQRSRMSRRKIRRFVERYAIDCTEPDRPLQSYRSFDDFFQRRLKPTARPIAGNKDTLISPADARLLAYPVRQGLVVPIKGARYSMSLVTAGEADDYRFHGGLCLVFRLAPVDYHRFCYIDDGEHGAHRSVPGQLHSVSPLALRYGVNALHENQRDVVVLRTASFGRVVEIDVGALTVGRIIQHYRSAHGFGRGTEKGCFAFGGSTIVLVFERDRVSIDRDIVEHSNQGIETLVRYGEGIGAASSTGRDHVQSHAE